MENTTKNTIPENEVQNAPEPPVAEPVPAAKKPAAKSAAKKAPAKKAPAKAASAAEPAVTEVPVETPAEAPAAPVKAPAEAPAAEAPAEAPAKVISDQTANQIAEIVAAKLAQRMDPPKAETRADKWKKRKEDRAAKFENQKKQRRLELEERKEHLKHTKMELSDKLKNLLSKEISDQEKAQKRRAAEILGVFSAHNFYANGFTPEELRTTLEDLGPTYVKIGQIMSSRVDLLPESYCKELEKLRQNVKELDPQIARAVIEQETGKKIEEIYSEFRDEPLGSASIGQAHYGVLKDGTKVVTKVQRPLIADMMRNDYVLLKKGAALINTVGEADDSDAEKLDLLAVIEEMEKVTEEELDFRVEAENTKFFKENCIEDESVISCPTVFDDLTTERIFTMTYVDGCSIGKKEKLKAQGCDFQELGKAILDNYLHQVLDVGTFHADPHQGNIMVSNKVPYWIDFGMIGHISDADVNTIQSLILSLLERDLDALVNAVTSLGATSAKTNRNKLMEDLDVMMDKYMNVTSINDVDLSTLLEEVLDLATKHHITIPGKFTMLVRSICTIEGVIEQLCPELNLFEIISGKLMDRARKSVDVQQELMSAGKDALQIGKKATKLPVLAYDALNNAVKGRMKMNMELTGYEDILNKAEKTIFNLVLAIFSCVLFFGSCILATADMTPKTRYGIPLLAAIGIIFSIALGIFTVRKMIKKK